MHGDTLNEADDAWILFIMGISCTITDTQMYRLARARADMCHEDTPCAQRRDECLAHSRAAMPGCAPSPEKLTLGAAALPRSAREVCSEVSAFEFSRGSGEGGSLKPSMLPSPSLP